MAINLVEGFFIYLGMEHLKRVYYGRKRYQSKRHFERADNLTLYSHVRCKNCVCRAAAGNETGLPLPSKRVELGVGTHAGHIRQTI